MSVIAWLARQWCIDGEAIAGVAADVIGLGEVAFAAGVQPGDPAPLRVLEAASPSSRWRRNQSAPSSQGSLRVWIQMLAYHMRAWLWRLP